MRLPAFKKRQRVGRILKQRFGIKEQNKYLKLQGQYRIQGKLCFALVRVLPFLLCSVFLRVKIIRKRQDMLTGHSVSGRFFLISPFMSWFYGEQFCILKTEEEVTGMDMKKIGIFLKVLRKEKGLTQEQAGEIFGVAGRTISRWENGVNMPDLSLLIQIADYYNVELEEILNGERRDKDMDKKLKDTLLKAADYSELEKKQKAKAGNVAFMLMFFVCVAGILIQIFFTGDIEKTMGETAAVIAGGIAYLSLITYNGLWEKTNEKKRFWITDLIISTLCGGVFSVVYGCCIWRIGGNKIQAVQLGAGFFMGITIVGFLILRGLSLISQKRRSRNERL